MIRRNEGYIVSISTHDGWVSVGIGHGPAGLYGGGWPMNVREPNFIERWLGVTFESKIERAKQSAQRWCDNHNAADRRTRLALANVKHGA